MHYHDPVFGSWFFLQKNVLLFRFILIGITKKLSNMEPIYFAHCSNSHMKNLNLVKSIFSHTQKVLFMSLVLILLVTTGCQNNDELKTKNEITSAEKYSNIPVEETMSFEGFASINESEHKYPYSFKESIKEDFTMVRAGMTTRYIYLPKDHPDYDKFYDLIVRSNERMPGNLLKVTIHDISSENGMAPIINVEKLPAEKQQELWETNYDPKLEDEA